MAEVSVKIMESSNRQVWADSLTGLCILYMLAMHVAICINVTNYALPFFYFFMPWFFYKSGMYYKEQPPKEVFRKDFRRLLTPFISFNLIAFFVIHIVRGDLFDIKNIFSAIKAFLSTGTIYENAPLWFLFSLISVRIIHSVVIKFTPPRNRSLWLYLEALAALLFALMLFGFNINKPQWIGPIFLGLFFFVMGNIIKFSHLSKFWIVVFFIIYDISCYILPETNMAVNTIKGNVFLYLLWCIFSIIALFLFGTLLEIVGRKNCGLAYIGKSSMVFYVTHWPILQIMKESDYLKDTLDPVALYMVIFISLLVSGVVLNKIFHIRQLRFLMGNI